MSTMFHISDTPLDPTKRYAVVYIVEPVALGGWAMEIGKLETDLLGARKAFVETFSTLGDSFDDSFRLQDEAGQRYYKRYLWSVADANTPLGRFFGRKPMAAPLEFDEKDAVVCLVAKGFGVGPGLPSITVKCKAISPVVKYEVREAAEKLWRFLWEPQRVHEDAIS